MTQEQGLIPQCELTGVVNQAIVTIAVKNGKLRIYPRRNNDVVAYFKNPGQASPEKPDQIRWVVRDITGNQSVVIRAKNPGSGFFPSDEYEITPGCNSIVSGMPRVQPPHNGNLDWAYSISLMEDGRVVDFIDPMVIIKNDP